MNGPVRLVPLCSHLLFSRHLRRMLFEKLPDGIAVEIRSDFADETLRGVRIDEWLA